jgi:AAA15 family ATPase/GTPase
VYTKRLSIKNFRCFEQAELELNYPGRKATTDRPVPSRYPNVNLLLGGNGTGKTSICRAAILGVLSPVLATSSSGFRADFLISRSKVNSTSANDAVGDIDEAHVGALLQLQSIDSEIVNSVNGEWTYEVDTKVTKVFGIEDIEFDESSITL